MATLQMGDTTFEKGDTETEKAPYFRGFGGYPELFKSCFPHHQKALKTLSFRGFFLVYRPLLPFILVLCQKLGSLSKVGVSAER